MALNEAKVHAGPCRIFAGVTAAASGTPPTYTTHTDGVPGTGTEVGLTEGDAKFKYKLLQGKIEPEQSLAAVGLYAIGEDASLTFVVMEQTYFTLQQAFNNVGKESVAGGVAFWFGGGTSVLAPTISTIMLTSRQRNAPTKFIITQLYKAGTMDGFELAFKKKGHSVYQVTYEALADLTRTAGDQVGYHRFEL
jgi:hypothetical protein